MNGRASRGGDGRAQQEEAKRAHEEGKIGGIKAPINEITAIVINESEAHIAKNKAEKNQQQQTGEEFYEEFYECYKKFYEAHQDQDEIEAPGDVNKIAGNGARWVVPTGVGDEIRAPINAQDKENQNHGRDQPEPGPRPRPHDRPRRPGVGRRASGQCEKGPRVP